MDISPGGTPRETAPEPLLKSQKITWKTRKKTFEGGSGGGLTHDFGSGGGADDDGEVGGDEGHAGLDVLVDAVLGLVQLQGHVARLLDALQLLLRQLLPDF